MTARAPRTALPSNLALLALLLVPLPGSALQAPGSAEPDSVVALDPVVVRVLRSSVGTGAPYPVSVAAGPELRRGTGGAFLEETLRALPGLQIQNRFNLASAERLVIRGFGSRAQFGIRGVRVLVDGIPATLPDGQTALDHFDPGTVGRAELLRGPGAALYGNAAGGVLHLRSLAPPASGTEVSAEAGGGSFGLSTWHGALSGRTGDLGYRVSVSRMAFDGFRTDPLAADGGVFGGATRSIVNAGLTLPAGAGTLRVVVNGLDMEADNPGSLSRALLDEGDRQAFRFNVIQKTREDIRQGQLGATWSGPLGALDGEVSAWGIRRDFLGAIPPAIVTFDRTALGARAIFRGTQETSAGTLTVGGGVEAELQRDDRRNWENDGGERGAETLAQDEEVRSTGLFFQGRLDVSEAFALSGGLRFDRFSFDATDTFLSDGSDDSGARSMDAWSPSVGIVARPAPEVELFASLASAFQTPTTTELSNRPNGAGGFNAELDPTRAWTVEGGVRARLGAAWTGEATLFRTSLSDELVPFEVPSAPGRSFFRNAGSSHHTGWEVAADGRLAPGVSVRVAYTRVDARFDTYLVDGDDFSGNRIPGLSPYRVDGRLGLERGRAYAEVRGLYADAVPVNDANAATSPAYFVGDVRAGLDGYELGDLAVSPWVALQNVFDRRYNASVVVNAFGGRFFEPGPGRTVRLGAAVTWRSRPPRAPGPGR